MGPRGMPRGLESGIAPCAKGHEAGIRALADVPLEGVRTLRGGVGAV